MDLQKLFITIVIIAVFGGITAFLLNSVIPQGDAMISTVVSIGLAAVFLIFLAKTEGIEYMEKLPYAIVFLFLLGTIGTLISGFIPAFSQYFLSVNNFSLSGLFYTIFYIGAGSMIAEKIGVL